MSLAGVNGKKDFIHKIFSLNDQKEYYFPTLPRACISLSVFSFIPSFIFLVFFFRDTPMVWPLCPLGIQRKLIIVFKPSMEGGLVGVKSLPKRGMELQIIRWVLQLSRAHEFFHSNRYWSSSFSCKFSVMCNLFNVTVLLNNPLHSEYGKKNVSFFQFVSLKCWACSEQQSGKNTLS